MTDLTTGDRLSVPDAVVSRELDGETVLLNLDTGIYFGLDEVATDMWRALAGGATIGDAIAMVHEEYDVDAATVGEDLLRLATQLVSKGLLQRAAGQP